MVRVYELKKGDIFFVSDHSPVAIGSIYMNYPAKIVKIYYEPRKWWQFWKKKKQIGYEVMWEGND